MSKPDYMTDEEYTEAQGIVYAAMTFIKPLTKEHRLWGYVYFMFLGIMILTFFREVHMLVVLGLLAVQLFALFKQRRIDREITLHFKTLRSLLIDQFGQITGGQLSRDLKLDKYE